MKKISFILFFICMGFFTSAQIVTDSLLAMYSFNNGTAEDDIGPWDRTPVNTTLIPDRFGNPDQAYWLNGTPKSYIKLGTTSVLKPAECSISMLMLGVLGEYVWRIFDEIKHRPSYIVDKIL